MVQWLGLHTSIAGAMASIPGQRTKISHVVWHHQKKKQNNNNNNSSSNKTLLREIREDLNKWRGFPDTSVSEEFTCNVGDPRLIPELGRSPGEGIGYPL